MTLRLGMFMLLIVGLETAVARDPWPGPGGFNASLRSGAAKGKSAAPIADFRVVIDAGHGGKDPGGMGANSQEKHIALSIVIDLARRIGDRYPGVEVLLTRNDDTFVPLYERAAIANRAGADLFISIHANIMPGSSATYGTETFVMGQHVADHNLAVAKRENAAVLLEADYEKNYDYDPNSDEGHILLSMAQHAFLERSIEFADLVETAFAGIGRRSRGVKQAGFVVLKETTMPAVLVETGFMSNPREETYLLSDTGQRELAEALFQAFGKYYQRRRGSARPAPVAPPAPATALSPPPFPKSFIPKGAATTPPPVTRREVAPSSAPPNVIVPTPAAYPLNSVRTGSDTLKPAFRFANAASADETRRRRQPRAIDYRDVPDTELTYAVQLFVLSQPLGSEDDRFGGLSFSVREVREKGRYVYQVRGLRNGRDVTAARVQLKAAGFTEMMDVVYYRGHRLPAPTVRYLITR